MVGEPEDELCCGESWLSESHDSGTRGHVGVIVGMIHAGEEEVRIGAAAAVVGGVFGGELPPWLWKS